ncbi:uncharacterized protein LOC144654938 [Oculina patagonica]
MAAIYFAILFKYAALVALIAFSLLAVSDGCTSKSDCRWGQVCCNNKCVSGSSCVGQSCWFDSDCSNGESCCNSKCVYGSSCVGQSCSSDSDCSTTETCCNKKCRHGFNCRGYSCSTDSDCQGIKKCCDGDCYDRCSSSRSTAADTAAIIVGPIIGTIAFIIMISLCIACACCRRQRALRHGRVIEGITIQSNQPSARVIQSYPHHPPAQYEQHQRTTNPAPYNPETMAASEQPPPS